MKKISKDDHTLLLDYYEDKQRYNDQINDAEIVRSSRIIWVSFLLLIALLIWSYFAVLVEVSTGTGKVVPTSKDQVIQSLEGGIISELYVKEGDVVEKDQILVQLDLTKTEANVEESASKYRAGLASIARLEAEVNGTDLKFPDELQNYPLLILAETRLYNTRKKLWRSQLRVYKDHLN